MTALVFADTNVLVYHLDTREPRKQSRARAWVEFLWTTRSGRISFQVLDPGLDRETARQVVRALWAWQPVPVDERSFAAAWEAQDRFGLSWWDSLIVGAARLADCRFLLTEDLQHDQDLDGLRVVSPFAITPAELAQRA
jgi:predicted nucleic acid-binding protein